MLDLANRRDPAEIFVGRLVAEIHRKIIKRYGRINISIFELRRRIVLEMYDD